MADKLTRHTGDRGDSTVRVRAPAWRDSRESDLVLAATQMTDYDSNADVDHIRAPEAFENSNTVLREFTVDEDGHVDLGTDLAGRAVLVAFEDPEQTGLGAFETSDTEGDR